jgi:endonuclease/exonuclease/phosphatase family metal-dependent hydrolase
MGHLLLFALLSSLATSAQPLRVMSYNVRYPNPDDGENRWEARRELFFNSVREVNPDLIGTQELFKHQGDEIVEHLPAYAWFGISRRGNDQDEHMGVFYKKDRLRLIRQDQFWLSESPNQPGSQSWNMSLPRMVSWAEFDDNGRRFYFFNTHFAHRREDEDARLKSARLLVERIRQIAADTPLVVTGDFNAPAGGEVHAAMLAHGLRDSRAIAREKAGPEGTFHGFRGVPSPGRIDWVLISPHWVALRNETLAFHQSGRYPSDHFPVLAQIELR